MRDRWSLRKKLGMETRSEVKFRGNSFTSMVIRSNRNGQSLTIETDFRKMAAFFRMIKRTSVHFNCWKWLMGEV